MRELKTKIILLIRWIAVLPVAIGAFILANYVTTIIIYIGSVCSEDWWFKPLLERNQTGQLINSITTAIAFVWAGTKTAPKYRLIVAISLTGFFGGFMVLSFFIAPFMQGLNCSLKWYIICGLVSMAAAILTCVEICREIVNEIRNKFLSAGESQST